MKILLTGGSGFVGKNLVRALSERHDVFAPRHGALDLLDPTAVDEFLAANRVDVVVHSAMQGGPQVLDQTLRMQANLVRNLGRNFDRLLYFGSGAEFAKNRDIVRMKEEAIGEQVPPEPYGLAKLYCTEQARARPRILNLRLFGVYGPHEGCLNKFISNSIAKNLLRTDIVVRQDVRFDYLWIGDLTRVVEHFLSAVWRFADLNVTPDESITLSDITRLINGLSKYPSRVEFESTGMNFEYTGDNARLRSEFPTVRLTPIEEGIAALTAFYENHPGEIDAEAIRRDDYAARCSIRKPGSAEK